MSQHIPASHSAPGAPLGLCCAADFGVLPQSIIQITANIYNLTVAYDPGVVYVGDQVVVSASPVPHFKNL